MATQTMPTHLKGKPVANRLPLSQRWKRTPANLPADPPADLPEPARKQKGAVVPGRWPLIDQLLEYLRAYLGQEAVDNIHHACLFGLEAHAGQTRESGEALLPSPARGGPHPRGNAHGQPHHHRRGAAATWWRTPKSPWHSCPIASAVTWPSWWMASARSACWNRSPGSTPKRASFRKMFMATAKDIRVIIIKLADRLHNMRTLAPLKQEKKRRVAWQTLDIYAPIANRLGMRDLAQKLEDLSLQSLYPTRYNAISKKLNSNKRRRKSVINELCGKIEQELKKTGITAQVVGREKDIYSIYRKMRQKKLLLQGCPRHQCHSHRHRNPPAVLPHPRHHPPVIHAAPGKLQGLHRHPEGEWLPVAAHRGHRPVRAVRGSADSQPGRCTGWRKTGSLPTGCIKPKPPASTRRSSWRKNGSIVSSKSQQKSLDSGEFLEHLKADLFLDEVYVFTPKGDIKQLPRGATALDFAYAVHTDVGNRCIGARINQQMVPLHEGFE